MSSYRRPALASALSVAMAVGIMAGSSAGIAAAATPANTLNLKVLVIGGVGGATVRSDDGRLGCGPDARRCALHRGGRVGGTRFRDRGPADAVKRDHWLL